MIDYLILGLIVWNVLITWYLARLFVLNKCQAEVIESIVHILDR